MKQLEGIVKHWQYIAPYAAMPENDHDLEEKITFLNELLDIVAENENHPLQSLIDLLSSNIEQYEHAKFEHSLGNGIDALKFLMAEQGLSQADLPEIGSQGVVSEILHGKRKLNRGQIERLSARFNISPATFFE